MLSDAKVIEEIIKICKLDLKVNAVRDLKDCIPCVEIGAITVFLPEEKEAFDVKNEEAMLILERVKYQLISSC